MTRTISRSIEIEAAPERVWKILTDLDRYPEWNPFIKRIAGSTEAGSRLEVRLQPPGGRAMTFKPKVLVSDAQAEFRWLGNLVIPGLFDGEHIFRLEQIAGDRTRFVQEEHFTGILVGLFGSTLSGAEEGFHQMNLALKERAEAEQTAESQT